jgi:hypothetical protein
MQPKYLIIHHIGAMPADFPDDDPVPTIRGWHTSPPRNWSDIAYHKVINSKGKVFQGREDSVQGAHAFGANASSLGLLMVGDFTTKAPTVKQVDALVQTLATLCRRHGIKPDKIIGHRDVAKLFPGGAASACPGDALYALLPSIRARVSAYL